MEIRRLARALGLATVIAALTLTACSGGNDEVPSAGGSAEVGTTNDINPQPVDELQQGGNLRLALNDFPPNFNSLHIDGNTGDVGALMRSTMPRAFRIAADGSASVNTDFFTDVELTSTDPQVVTYTINPDAVWSDGTPITWEDIQSQINATSGTDEAFAIAATNGSDRVEKVERGVDDRQAVITFAQPWADWQGMFAGSSVLLPKSSTATPEAFNRAQLSGPGPSAGPFIISNLDRGAKRITLTRNPKWWATPPVLDTVTYLVLDDAARIPALQNNTIDATGLATLDEMEIARRTQGVSVRRAPGLAWYHFTFNGAPGSILADPALRRAIAKGIDRKTIAEVTQRGLADNPEPLNNHIYVAGQEGYQDNSGVVAFDPDKARQELDALGWRLNGQFREKDGRQLVIRDVLFDSIGTRQYGQIAQNNLAQIGVKLELDIRPAAGFFTDFVTVGNFDIAQFAWSGDAFPLASLTQIYRTGAESNFGKISTPQIDAKIEETVSELDPVKARQLANELDKLLFEEVFSLPLTQSTGNIAARTNLANFGAFGLADPDYTKIGFMKP
ncbi:ABC transporter family substrate-binding protein [Mycobacterium sp. IDR2000157661]|uniref:ABC transporter family substrate-binding protein n=1 Tax=Mycobacterium sp. IDR2000157661 TaxID=2867005 RepID=UPI001EECB50C|nr:ABC transporter family substrate-binding protein [Mycobacterium sp. IDR2000157661]ULE31559.1 ABC transporter family substrate-binding protein [Mycobacterium sp. IDR2000157661]